MKCNAIKLRSAIKFYKQILRCLVTKVAGLDVHEFVKVELKCGLN